MATATYPPPPPYYKLYKDYLQDPKSAPEPSPPIEGTYVCYGAKYTTDDVLPSLEEQGVRQLYPKGPNIDSRRQWWSPRKSAPPPTPDHPRPPPPAALTTSPSASSVAPSLFRS